MKRWWRHTESYPLGLIHAHMFDPLLCIQQRLTLNSDTVTLFTTSSLSLTFSLFLRRLLLLTQTSPSPSFPSPLLPLRYCTMEVEFYLRLHDSTKPLSK